MGTPTSSKKGTNGIVATLPKTMNQYRNINPEDDSERFCRFQIHKKSRIGDTQRKPYYQALVMLPAAIKREIDWQRGDVLVMKFDKKTGTLMIRRLLNQSSSQHQHQHQHKNGPRKEKKR